MSKQEPIKAMEIHGEKKKIVLAGNPNVGKSVFFNSLTGLYVDVSNFPGTTVDVSHGHFEEYAVIDTPGVYGISSFNDEEKVARDVILTADLIVNVVDAVHLERDLFLSLQVIETGIPTIIVLNMMDDAKREGLKIDLALLEEQLGVPVIPAVAIKGKGLKELKEKLREARTGNIPLERQAQLKALTCRNYCRQSEALLILEGDEIVAKRIGVAPGTQREEIYQERRQRVDKIVAAVVSETLDGATFATKLGRAMLNPLTGVPIFLMALACMYYIIGVLVAQDIVGLTEETIMQGMYEPAVRTFISSMIYPDSVLGKFLIGEFGLLTMTVTYVFGLLLPLVLGFYFILSVMEDSGYLPRLAALVDRVMNAVGLNGRAIIPMILGFGCVTLAIISTRLLGSQRERTIGVALLGLAIPCSAQLGVITGLLAALGPMYVALYVGIIVLVLGVVGRVLHKILPGEATDLLIDLPPLRFPRLSNVAQKMFIKSYGFIKEATPVFALGALIITTLDVTNSLVQIQDFLAPLTNGWLKLPRETANVFIMGLIRRDFGAAGLSNMVLSPEQLLVSLVTITLFVPCIASVIVLFKERSKTEGLLVWFGSWVAAFLIGGLVAQIII